MEKCTVGPMSLRKSGKDVMFTSTHWNRVTNVSMVKTIACDNDSKKASDAHFNQIPSGWKS